MLVLKMREEQPSSDLTIKEIGKRKATGDNSLRFDYQGLIPVIVQEAKTGEILMLAYANMEAILLTLSSGHATYFSRVRGVIWIKGETSGNFQKVLGVYTNCDQDALIYRVQQKGVACHTGNKSCFYKRIQPRSK